MGSVKDSARAEFVDWADCVADGVNGEEDCLEAATCKNEMERFECEVQERCGLR